MSKITPSGSLNLSSKLTSSFVLPNSKKNVPPAASMRARMASRSSTWKPKWCAPTKFFASLRPEPDSPLYLSSARLITPSLRRSEEHTSELQSRSDLVCRLLLEKKKKKKIQTFKKKNKTKTNKQ